MSSAMEWGGGNMGGVLAPGDGLDDGDRDRDDGDDTRRVCTKWGMVDMSGESAHGFVWEDRLCSSVGSMYLTLTRERLVSGILIC